MTRLAATLLLLVAVVAAPLARAGEYLNAALDAATWVSSTAVSTPHGTAWPSDPSKAATVSTSLYYGNAGIVLFLLELHAATGDGTWLQKARAGADYLLAHQADERETGLYEGTAGIAFALTETFKATGDRRYRDGARNGLRLLKKRAAKAGAGIEWNDSADVISGGAGTGLVLLYLARELEEPAARTLAVQAGARLIELGRADGGGLKWAMTPSYPRLMPNFSHGTAGIAYFMATLYRDTKDERFLQAALAGGRYLQSIATTQGDVCLIFHHEPDGKDLHYLSWCHGPAGTARLFYRLYEVTGDATWMQWTEKSARAILASGIPERQTPGFWNNVSQCCGSAGVAEFMLGLHRVTGNDIYLRFARDVTADLLRKALPAQEGGLKWPQAEHRVKPAELVAQTGYMQGAAGIGTLLLHLDTFERGRKPRIVLPDTPF